MTPIVIRSGSTSATVEPQKGFNCYSLVVDGFDYLHRAPDFLPDGSPTHSGIPILFPWPNRIGGARFTWDGLGYDLPVTEPATGTSLHGFACHAPWRVVTAGPDEVTGEFVMSREAPATVDLWPADAGVRVTYRVEPSALLVTAEVFSNDGSDLPFGLGFHPYFRVPGPFDQWLLQCDAAQAWPLSAMVPSGPPVDVPPDLDFRTARRLRDQHLDDVLTGLPEATGLQRRAALLSMASSVTVSSDPAFGDYVMFTPTSRDAVAIEPYTCATDAVNLQARGIAAGWRVLDGEQTATFTWRMDVA